MQMKRLEKRQLFNMLGNNLEKRISNFYGETKDVSTVIEYVVTLLVRQALTLNFSDSPFICQDVIREIFLNAAPTNTQRRFSVFFEDYFDKNEWKTISARLYRDNNNFLAATEEARLYKAYLKEKDPTRTDELADHQFVLKAIFKGENGRRHTWTVKNAHPTKNREEVAGALKILTMLTIFETNGVRKFSEFVDFHRDAFKSDLQFIEEEEQAEVVEEIAKKNPSKSKSGKKASGKKIEKQPKSTSVGNYEDIKDIPIGDLIDGQLADQSISSGRDPNESVKPFSGKLKTPSDSTKETIPPNHQHSSAKKQKKAGAGKVKNDQNPKKNQEQIEQENEKRRIRNKIAKYFKKRGK